MEKKDERDLLDVLKFELQFLEKGGYGRSPRQPWRFQYIFEDSPTCMNYDSKENPGPRSDCVLTQLVPPEFRDSSIPCRHIPLNAEGETLDSLYRYADQREIEETFGKWLRTTIGNIEEMRAALSGNVAKSLPGDGKIMGEPLAQKLHPKCATQLARPHFAGPLVVDSSVSAQSRSIRTRNTKGRVRCNTTGSASAARMCLTWLMTMVRVWY